jgi:site-specific recombinase XerD
MKNEKKVIRIDIFQAVYQFIHEACFIDEPGHNFRQTIEDFVSWTIERDYRSPKKSSLTSYVESLGKDPYYSTKIKITIAIFFNWLTSKGYMPVEDVAGLITISNDNNLRRMLTESELTKLDKSIDAKRAEGLRDRLLIFLLGLSGLSLSQILKIRIKDVNLDNSKIFIPSNSNRVRSQYIQMEHGTKQAAEMWILFRDNKEAPLFITLMEKKAEMTVQRLAGIVKARLNEAGLVGNEFSHDSLRANSINGLMNLDHSMFQIEKFLCYKAETLKSFTI